MDTRREHGQYWPGTRTDAGSETPAGTDNGKVDRVDLGTLPADATAAEMRTAIRNIQNAIRPLATAIAAALCGFVMAQTAPWDGLRGGVHVVTNEQDAVAMAEIARATNGIPAEIAAATNALHTSLAPTISAAATALQPAATNGLPERIDAVTNGLSAYALKTQIPDMPDLSPYALKSEVPPAPDLTGYATKYEVALATNGIPARIAASTNGLPEKIVAATNGIPARIAAATNGLPERIAAATNALHTSLAPAISAATTALQPAATNALEQEMAAISANLSDRIEQIALAFAASNTATRLATTDGSTYQDATGVVWRAENFEVPGLFSLQKIEYYTNGIYQAETNAPAGISWALFEEYKETWGIVAGESERAEDPEERYRDWLDFTNHVAAADMEDPEGTNINYIAQLDVAGETIELTTNGWIYATTVLIEWPMSETNRTRYMVFERTNVTATIRTPIDQVMYASETNAIISESTTYTDLATNNLHKSLALITTNDVCKIVTNLTNVFGDWTITPALQDGYVLKLIEGKWSIIHQDAPDEDTSYIVSDGKGNGESTEIVFNANESMFGIAYTATRTFTKANALGLARLIDLPPLTNGLPEAIDSKASTNDVLLAPVYGGDGEEFSRWTVFRDGTDVTLQVSQPTWGYIEGEGSGWVGSTIENDVLGYPIVSEDANATNITWFAFDDEHANQYSYTATRTANPIVGYTLGSQTDKALASTGSVAAVHTSIAPTIFTSAEWVGVTNRIAALEELLQGLESALHLINTGTNIVTEANQ